jgi:PAS domain S-box-containing protein
MDQSMSSPSNALSEREDLYNSAPCGFHSLDRDGVFVRVNDTELRWLGYPRDELVGKKKIFDLLAPESIKSVNDAFPDFIHQGQLRDLEVHLLRKDGSILPVLVSATAIRDFQGKYVMSNSVLYDITERKRMEAALRISEERFRVALKTSPVVVFNQDHELRYTWINSPVLGWAVQGYVGQTDAEIVGGEEGARLMAIKHDVLESGIGTRTEATVTFEGETHYYDLTVEPLRDVKGSVIGITCAAADVTPMKEAAVELERLNKLKTEFLGMAAHDLRNPIGSILVLAELLRDEVASVLTEEQLGYLSDIQRSSKFMLELVENFLDVASIESGNLRLNRCPSDLRKLLEHSVGLNAKLARQKHIHVSLQIEGALPRLSFDGGKIGQVLNNLLSNAVKFSQPETTVEVAASPQGDGVLISVRDHGPGLSEAECINIFQLFGRARAGSTAGERSTGLGLAISRKIVEGHGGHIWVESQIGVGSVFLFTLPA